MFKRFDIWDVLLFVIITPTVLFCAISKSSKLFTSELLPAPGGPVIPITGIDF